MLVGPNSFFTFSIQDYFLKSKLYIIIFGQHLEIPITVQAKRGWQRLSRGEISNDLLALLFFLRPAKTHSQQN